MSDDIQRAFESGDWQPDEREGFVTDDIAALIAELKARAHERAGKNSMVEVEQLLEWQAADALFRLTAPPLLAFDGAPAKFDDPRWVENAQPLPEEPTIPAMITVGRGRFHAGVKVSTVQGAIDRLVDHVKEQPLPEEIAGLIERLHRHPNLACMEAIKLLRAQAQEIKRLKDERNDLESDYLRRHRDACDRQERIRELEAERDDLVAQLHVALASVGYNQGVAAAIRAKTIKELIALMDKSKTWGDFERAMKLL